MPKARRYWSGKRGEGEAHKWLLANAGYDGDECLIWPFHRCRGYGVFGHEGKMRYAARFMCELVNGPPPTPQHQSAHTCGNGDAGCIHPRHLVWKTVSENQLDRRKDGTAVLNPDGGRGRLTDAQWQEIKSLFGTMTQDALAAQYGISPRHVRRINQLMSA